MIWMLTLLFFFLCVPFLMVGMVLYVKIQLYLSRKGVVAKYLLASIIFSIFACFIVSPMILGIVFAREMGGSFDDISFFTFFLACFALSQAPGILYFNKHYIKRMKSQEYWRR
ncbi:hypothetical protein [Saccharospirillum impatiens]|uniref:hypothetical protein n=1 Tax=Saccharospirillum impatiens TaxID=169438 RepID=UPI0012FB8852|nr:hypothetical protein [Saccharospirillum impatiens]